MKKSLIALLVVLALVITVSAFSVSAEKTTPVYASDLTVNGDTATGYCPHCQKENVTWTAWAAQTTAGHYFLKENYTPTASLAIQNKDYVLHLNGNEYGYAGQSFEVKWKGNLSIVDGTAQEGRLFTSGTKYAVTMTGSASSIKLYSGNFEYELASGNTQIANGGFAYITNNAAVTTMYGGTMTSSGVSGGGGSVYVYAGTFEMLGGTIENSSAKEGGAICASPNSNGSTTAKVIIDGGEITGCSATDRGGSISLRNAATLELKSGTIDGGTACGTQLGGNIYAAETVKVTISGGTISNGYTWNGTAHPTPVYDATETTKVVGYSNSTGGGRGGNLVLRGTSTLEMSDGTISGGSADSGGNICAEAGATATISGGTVTGGYAGTRAGNVYVNGSSDEVKATLNLQGTADIASGKSATTGGVYASAFANVNMTGGSISNNTSTNGGASLRFNASSVTFNMSSGTITGGKVTSTSTSISGGNIFLNVAAKLNITGGTISNGKGSAYGGNICITNISADSVISGLTISGGVAATGGNLDIAKSGITLTNCTISGGAGSGGNIYVRAGASGNFTLDNCKVNSSAWNGKDANDTTRNTVNGGGILIESGEVRFNNGSSMTGNGAMYGGSVYLNTANAKFTMAEGTTITTGHAQRNNATNTPFGGNIYVKLGTFTMNGGTISNGKLTNSAGNTYGGNVYMAGGSFVMNDGTITKGKAKTSGGNVYIQGMDAENLAVFTMNDGTISDGTCDNNQGGVRVADFGKFVMNDGEVSNNDSVYSGGNIAAQSATDGNPCYLDINGGTISDGDTSKSYGGNILIGLDAEATIDDATVTGGTAATYGGNIAIQSNATSAVITNTTITGGVAKSTTSGQGGGNIHNALVGTVITGCTISNGVAEGAQGGNLFNQANGLIVTRCRITGGTAGKRVETTTTDAETGEPVVTVTYPNTNGRGGNYGQVAGSATFTNCVIKDGTSYSSGGGGGNIYLNGTIGDTTFTSCTITGGHGQNQSGNLQHHADGFVIINGDSYIAGGYGGAWGSNIGVTNGKAILKIEGNTIVNATGCSRSDWNGVNIHISNVAAKVYLGGNSQILSGDTLHSIVVAGAGKVYLGGNAYMDKYIELNVGALTTAAAADTVIVQEGFTGDALLLTRTSSNYGTDENKSIAVGATVYPALGQEAGYADTGTIKVYNASRTGYVVSDTGDGFVVAGFTGFKTLYEDTENETVVEYGLADLSTAADYECVKLYTNTDGKTKTGEITLTANTPIDVNNQVVHFITNGYTLKAIDCRTDGGDVAKYTKFTADDESKITRLVTNPTTGWKYLNVKGEDGKWTSNRVRVEMSKVSLKTRTFDKETGIYDYKGNGIYYTTRIVANTNAAPYLVDYGTAVSLVEMPGENFLDVAEEKGILYTAFDLNTTKQVKITTLSALVDGILAEGATNPDNNTRASAMIYANSFVTAIVDGQEIKIMAEENYSHSLKDVMEMLDEKIATLDKVDDASTIETAVRFFNTWADPFAAWDTLPNLKAAAQAAA